MFGQPVGPYSAQAYVATMAIVHAVAAASKAHGGAMPTREQVLEQLRKTKNFTSITGTFSFDANGDTTARIISFYEAKSGKWIFVTQQNFTGLGK
jgi:branched-chain amino acid transport system substrate-binding protein